MLSDLSSVKSEVAGLRTELERYRECDPEVMQQMKEETVVAKEAANRWTGKEVIFKVTMLILNLPMCF